MREAFGSLSAWELSSEQLQTAAQATLATRYWSDHVSAQNGGQPLSFPKKVTIMRSARATRLALAMSLCFVAGVSQATSGIAEHAPPPSGQVAVPSRVPNSWTVIYSTLNDNKDHLYNSRTAWPFVGAEVHDGTSYSQAMPFTPSVDGTVRKIVLAIGIYSGTDNLVSVALREDADGLPGAIIKKFPLVDVPPAWQCCQTVAVGMKGVPVIAGKQYWVAMSARGDTSGVWYVNDLGLRGPMAHGTNDEWSLAEEKLSAFSVLGE